MRGKTKNIFQVLKIKVEKNILSNGGDHLKSWNRYIWYVGRVSPCAVSEPQMEKAIMMHHNSLTMFSSSVLLKPWHKGYETPLDPTQQTLLSPSIPLCSTSYPSRPYVRQWGTSLESCCEDLASCPGEHVLLFRERSWPLATFHSEVRVDWASLPVLGVEFLP